MCGILNLSKAFNCVVHSILLDKLKHYGIRGKCFNWFESYLKDRLQFTTIGSNISSKVKVPNGVPQGSVLGPILYLIYVNDIEYCNLKSRILMFADDTVVISSHIDPQQASVQLSNDLDVLSNYFGKLGLMLNAKKTKVMNFGKSWKCGDVTEFPVLKLDNQVIESVLYFKYLGVIIDINLNFRKHLEASLRSANSKLFMLNKIKNHLPEQTALLLYKTMVLPYLEFGNIFLLNCFECDQIKLQKMQNKSLRLLLRKDKRYSTVLLHRDARLASWRARALTAAMRLMFKFKLSLEVVAQDGSRAMTRSSMGSQFNIEHPNSSRFLKSISYLLRTEWNSLPASFRNFDDTELFNMSIKRFYKEKWESENNEELIV